MQTLPPQPLLLLNSKHRCNMGMAGQTLVCLAILVPIFIKLRFELRLVIIWGGNLHTIIPYLTQGSMEEGEAPGHTTI